MKKILCLLLLLASSISAQTYPDLGHALYAKGYTGTVWVDRFFIDGSARVDAHGRFNPNATGEDRYGTNIFGTGVPEFTSSGWVVHVTIHNRYNFSLDGKVSSDLYCSGPGCQFNLQGGSIQPMVPPCGPFIDCRYDLAFPGVANVTGPGVIWTATVYRHVEGSVCGGERTIDMNEEPCRTKLVEKFHLPSRYRFTASDNQDTNYASLIGGSTTALCTEVIPECTPPSAPIDSGPAKPPVVPPTVPPTLPECLAGCSQSCPSMCPRGIWPVITTTPTIPSTTQICPTGTACRAECAPVKDYPPVKDCPPEKPEKVCPPQIVCQPQPPPCEKCQQCPSVPVYGPNTACSEYLSTLKALAAGTTIKNPAKIRKAVTCVINNPGLMP